MKCDTQNDYILEDDRVLLRPLEKNDLKHLLPFAINEPNLWTYSLISGAGKSGIENYIDQALQARQKEQAYPFIIWDKQRQQYAGSTRFYDIQKAHSTFQLGFTWYGQEFQGTGLNQHCKYLLLSFAFDTMEVARVEFRADYRNKRSIAAMKNIGCTEEGVLRSNCADPNGGRRDSIVLSILKDEWNGGIKARLKAKLKDV